MKALITGVNGFVGQHLSEFLLGKGYQVYGIDMQDNNDNKKVKYIKCDITNFRSVNAAIKNSKPDLIFHLAAVSSPQSCENNPELTKKVNINGTENILLSCFVNKINPKVLITSSAQVYGAPVYTPIDEKHQIKPINKYGESKLEQEKAALKFFREKKIAVIISRSFNHIGPGQLTGFVCSDFAKQIAEIEKGVAKSEIHTGDLSKKRDFTDVRDIVKAYLLLLQKGVPGEIYNIGSGKAYEMKFILEKLVSYSKIKIKIIEDKNKFGKGDIPVLQANNRKFVNLTGWKPEIKIEDTLKDILNFWRKQV